MKKIMLSFLFSALSLLFTVANAQQQKQSRGFTENKGQVSDQNGNPRPDVLFSCTTDGLLYHLSGTGISYQLNRVETWKSDLREDLKPGTIKDLQTTQNKIPAETSIYRLDLEWLNINPNTLIQTDESLPGVSNYYLAVCPDGVSNAKTYKGIIYKNIYANIDLHYYLNGDHLKYDYLVAAGADYRQIKIKIKGATKITIQRDGSVVLKTPLGDVREATPLVYQDKKLLPSKWILNNDELSFLISNYDRSRPLLIDPLVRTWGTYYGASGTDEAKACVTDLNNNVYIAGNSNSTSGIATSGSFSTTLTGSNYDAFLAKFNSSGVRQWATYYGGSDVDNGNACVADASGNVYLAGQVGPASTAGIASPASGHQGFHGGGAYDAFLVKFNSTGTRLWGTYYGGSGYDKGEGLAVDASSNVYMSGYATSASGGFPANPIATSNGHQFSTVGSAFLVKFSSAGVRQWGTYYGDSQYSHGNTCVTDGSGNVFMAGNTDAQNLIATTGAHQTSQIGLADGFLVKFNAAGVRQWGTYYGEISLESINACATDASGNVYIGGSSGSPTGIATTGAHQTVIGLTYNPDGMLVKFNSAGVRQWGTYYGGGAEDVVQGCIVSPGGDLYITGITVSSNNISSANAYQSVYGGTPSDAFIARFTQAGVRVWGTYYGGVAEEIAYACAADALGNVYMAGRTDLSSGTTIATSGGHQSAFGGTKDAFLVQFNECILPADPVNVTASANLSLCSGATTTLSAIASGTINWFSSATSANSIGTGTAIVTPTLSAGNFTYFAESTNTCGTGPSRTPVVFTVLSLPYITLATTELIMCNGQSATLTAYGASQYTWASGPATRSIVVSPTTTTAYSVTGTSTNSCQNNTSITLTVTNCTGVNDISSGLHINVYPNPVKDIVTIRSSEPLEVRLFNSLGQLLLAKRTDPADPTLFLNDLPSGVYLLEIKKGEFVQVAKLIKD